VTAVRRLEDLPLITGAGQYIGDLAPADVAHVAFLRSPYGHARLRRIELDAARARPGVLIAISGADLRDELPLLTPPAERPGLITPAQPCLAADVVRYVGEPIAAIAATDPYLAVDALDAIHVEYEPLPAVTDPEAALADGAPLVHENVPGNLAYTARQLSGDVDAAFAAADFVLRLRLEQPRLAAVPMEGRGIVAQWDWSHHQDDGRTLTVWISNQAPYLFQRTLATLFQLDPAAIRVITPDVGGAFGAKTSIYGEDAVVIYLARRLGRPVKWIESRSENLQAMIHGRGQIDLVEVAARRDGMVLALRCTIISDLGAYVHWTGPLGPQRTTAMLAGAYRIGAVDIQTRGVLTNTVMRGAYRGAGRPEAAYVIERVMDAVARETGLDPVEVRRRNFIPPDAFPYHSPCGVIYDSGNYAAALDRALELLNYPALRAEQQRLRAQGRFIGIGLSCYVELGATSARPFGAAESARVSIETDGTVQVTWGLAANGQGHRTAFARIVSAELGVPIERIRTHSGDTADGTFSAGTFASRAVAVGGSAVLLAARAVKERALQLAADVLEAAPVDLVCTDGAVFVRGMPSRRITLADLAARAAALEGPDGPGLAATRSFDPDPADLAFPFGTHIAVVEVHPETGEVKLLRYIAVDDCGRVIVPELVDGQLHGGIVQGISQALTERVVYDNHGQLLSATLMDYALPVAADLVPFTLDRTETPSPRNPLGAKGVGEAGTTGAPPAIVNAVLDALAPLGITHLDMPLYPQRIWEAIHRRRPGTEP
jgi:carbon-monoxide dehydrogenase large subunit